MNSLLFYVRYSWFSFQEQLTDIAGTVIAYLILPLFLLVLSALWRKFNGHTSHYLPAELIAYLGVAQVLFMTFLRAAYFSRSASDFSLSLARPRSWLVMSGVQLCGRILAARLMLAIVLVPWLLVLGVKVDSLLQVWARLLLLLPPLTVLAALYNLLFANAKILWEQSGYFSLPFSKLALVFGGVFGPLDDLSTDAKLLMLSFPPSDLFFQPAHFCVQGYFHSQTALEWSARVSCQAITLAVINFAFHTYARKNHQVLGG